MGASKKRVHNKLNLQFSTPPTLSDQEISSPNTEMIYLEEEPQVPNLRIKVPPPELPPIVDHAVPGERSLFQQDFLTLDWSAPNTSPFRHDKAASLFVPSELQDPIKLPGLPGFSMPEID